MSQESAPSVFTSVTYEDAVDFFSKRTPLPCPACGYSKWGIASPAHSTVTAGETISFGLAGVKTSSGALLSAGFPLISAVCKKCYFVRPHALMDVSNWVAQGKPEFIEIEEV